MRTDRKITLERAIRSFYYDAVRMGLRNPRFLVSALHILKNQLCAAAIRRRKSAGGVHVPPFIIFSITGQCNLSCKGCYARHLRQEGDGTLPLSLARRILEEAGNAGVATVLLAGGEPLLRPDIVAITRDFPRILFPIFTNGLLIDDSFVTACKKRRNLVPVISIEGDRNETDLRRGDGVFATAEAGIGRLQAAGIFYGISMTVTSRNYKTMLDGRFVERYRRRNGCHLFFFVEYVPVEAGTDDLIIGKEQRRDMMTAIASLRKKYAALFIAFPGDEEQFGGCLAAGRGFVHVNPQGDLEACPMAPFSDTNLQHVSLLDSLASPMLKKIRDNHHLLQETNGGCALWENRERVKAMLAGPRPRELLDKPSTTE